MLYTKKSITVSERSPSFVFIGNWDNAPKTSSVRERK